MVTKYCRNEVFWLLFPLGQSGNALLRNAKNARLFKAVLILAGKLTKREHSARISIA